MVERATPTPQRAPGDSAEPLQERVERLEDALAVLQELPKQEDHPLTTIPTAPRRWLLFDFLAELRLILRMFFDIHYRVAWSTRVIVLVLVPMILLVHWWLPLSGVWVVGALIQHVVIMFLAFFVYKALSREARRYAESKGHSV